MFIGTNPAYTAFELTHILKIAKVRFVMAEPTILTEMEKAMNQIGIAVAQNLLLLNANHNTSVSSPRASTKYKSWTTLLDHGERPWIRFDDEERSTKTTACLFNTSGTTGLPKCAATSHRNLVAQHQLFYEANPRSYRLSTVLSMPFFHVGILPNVLISVLREGRNAYIMQRFELKTFLSYHSKFNILMLCLYHQWSFRS
jgi:long-subunit acyl-CoA synthetase (AMP-forming)